MHKYLFVKMFLLENVYKNKIVQKHENGSKINKYSIESRHCLGLVKVMNTQVYVTLNVIVIGH